jgi:hypothetical protein
MANETPKISTYDMDGWTGQVPSWKPEIQPHERAGVDGYTLVQLGKRSAPFEIKTRKTTTGQAAANALAAQYEALTSRIITIREPGGRSHSRIVVLDCTPRCVPLAFSTDGGTYLVEATWRLHRAGG